MTDTYVIEVGSSVAGIVVWDGFGYLFCSADRSFNPLDGVLFCSPGDAERAARRYRAATTCDSAAVPKA